MYSALLERLESSTWFRYGMIGAAFAVATAVRMLAEPLLQSRSPFVLYLPAVAFAALLSPLVVSIFVATAGGVIGYLLFSYDQLWAPIEWTIVFFYLLSSGFIIAAAEIYKRDRLQLKTNESLLESTQRQLKEALADRENLLESERAARSESERANRQKDDFIARVSHELRTPLNAILGWAQLLQRKRVDPARGVTIIEQNARAQAQLIDDLLDVSRMTTGTASFEVKVLPLDEVIMSSIDRAKPAAEEKNMKLIVELPEDACFVEGDPARLQQLLWNILSNAIKFTHEGGEVSIKLAAHGPAADISISDTGEGIEPALIPAIFDRFNQADLSTTRRHAGLGLGLVISKHIVELHGGSLHAASAGPGRGSTFTITLPTVEIPDAAATEEETELEIEHPFQHGLSLLVVDDEVTAVEMLSHILTERGALVYGATSASQALSILESERIDVLISDIGMPNMDGYTLVRTIRKLRDQRRNVPAVALTAYARPQDKAKALDAGFTAYMSKPVNPMLLLRLVSAIVKERADGREGVAPLIM